MMKLALAVLVGATVAGGAATAFVSPAFAEDPDVHHHDKAVKPGAHGGGAKAGGPKALHGAGGLGAGVAAGIFGAALGATVLDVFGHANAQASPPP